MADPYNSSASRNIRVVGVVSDTHGHVHNTRRAVRMFESFQVDAVVHCGDIGSQDIPPLFCEWVTHYVLGNVDARGGGLENAIRRAGGVLHGRFGKLTASGRRIAFLHGDDTERLGEAIYSGRWDLVCHGHSHKANVHQEGATLVLNPGALQRAFPPSIAIVDLETMDIVSIPLD